MELRQEEQRAVRHYTMILSCILWETMGCGRAVEFCFSNRSPVLADGDSMRNHNKYDRRERHGSKDRCQKVY